MARRVEPQAALGRAVRELRAQREMSQEALGHAADLHPTWVSHIERGQANPAWGTVERIAAALGVRVSELAALAEKLADESGGSVA